MPGSSSWEPTPTPKWVGNEFCVNEKTDFVYRGTQRKILIIYIFGFAVFTLMDEFADTMEKEVSLTCPFVA